MCDAFSHFCVRPVCCVFYICRLCVAAAIHPDASSAFSFPPRTRSHLLSPLRLQFNLFLSSRSASLSCLSEDSHSARLSLSIAIPFLVVLPCRGFPSSRHRSPDPICAALRHRARQSYPDFVPGRVVCGIRGPQFNRPAIGVAVEVPVLLRLW